MMGRCPGLALCSFSTYFGNASWYRVIEVVSSLGLISIPLSHFLNNRNCRKDSRMCPGTRSIPIVGVTSVQYLDSFSRAHFTAKSQSYFHWFFFLARTHITQSIWSNMSLRTVITWCRVRVCLFNIHSVQYWNGPKPPWHTWRWCNHPVLWRVAGNQFILDFWATSRWIHVICRHAWWTPLLNSTGS